jgi:hypothetical protein
MFTLKLMKGQTNETIKLIEAAEVEVKLYHSGGTQQGTLHAIVVTPPYGEQTWHYLGHSDWDMAVIENSAGKTTEVVRAPENPGLQGAAANIGRAA